MVRLVLERVVRSYPLHVKSNDNEPIARFEGDNDTIVLIQGNSTENGADEVGIAIKGDSSKEEYWFIGTDDVNESANSLNFVASNNLSMAADECKMTLTQSGNLGIGTASPDISLAIGDSDTGFDYASNGNFGVKTNNSWCMYWNSNQNVGIGTNAPTEKLHVNGDTKLDGFVGIGGDPSTSDKLRVVGNIKTTGNSIIDGTSVLTSDVIISTTSFGSNNERLIVNGLTKLEGLTIL